MLSIVVRPECARQEGRKEGRKDGRPPGNQIMNGVTDRPASYILRKSVHLLFFFVRHARSEVVPTRLNIGLHEADGPNREVAPSWEYSSTLYVFNSTKNNTLRVSERLSSSLASDPIRELELSPQRGSIPDNTPLRLCRWQPTAFLF